jgi:PKD repeat protein
MKLKSTIVLMLSLLTLHYAKADVYIVTNNADSGPGSLRQAITDADTNPGRDTINFDIAASDVAGRTITLLTNLPGLSSPVLIDGTTQVNGSNFGLTFARIQITTAASISNGISVLADSCEIYGLYLNNFENGILIQNPHTKIGAVLKGNVIFNCSSACIKVQFTDHVAIQSNILGLDTFGLAQPGAPGNGIEVSSSYAVSIGGKTEQAINVISGNNYGVFLNDATFVDLNSNHIGTNILGYAARPNQYGIYATGAVSQIEIGGDSAFEENLISGNVYAGIYGGFNESAILGNRIGTDFSGTGPLSNGTVGIYLSFGSSDNQIGGDTLSEPNLIAYNGQQAIAFQNSTCQRNTITHNSIFCNSESFGSGGIDTHAGNGDIHPPQLLIVNPAGVAGVTVPNGVVEMYYDDSCNWCEGKTFLASVIADAAGTFVYNGSITAKITATATDTAGNTSEFAECVDSTATVCMIGGFTTSVPSGCAQQSVTFFDQTITAPGSTVSSWTWDFGDGSSSTLESPTYSYFDPGTYTVQLIVTNSTGCSDTVSVDFVVNEPPAAQFQATPPQVCLGDSIAFDDQSYAGYNATIVNWDWNFDDGTTGTGENPTHLYATGGTYDVSLVITNSNGCTSTFTQAATVLGTPDVAFTSSISTLQVTFTNTTTTNGAATYLWDFGDGGTSTSENPIHNYTSFGVYTVCLTVFDSTCLLEDSTCQTIDLITGIGNINAADALIAVSPNPAVDFITLSNGGLDIQTIRLLNITGAEVYSNVTGHYPGNALRIDLPGVPAGIYLLKIETDKGIVTKKIVIEKE